MATESTYLLAADALLVAHTLFVGFVVLGLAAIYVGYWLSWHWVRNFWFRVLHLWGIGFVVLESWIGVICPLTTWEMQLRTAAGQSTYEGSFIQHWLHTLLYYEAPGWVFTVIYTAFGGLVLASWFIVRPSQPGIQHH
ncbi:MAG: DUF2784 domain-containing protein [bacterium]